MKVLRKALDRRRARRVARLLREIDALRRGCEQLSVTTDRGDRIRRAELRRRMAELLEEIREAETPVFGELAGPGAKAAVARGGPYLETRARHCPRCRVTLLPADTRIASGAAVHSRCGTTAQSGTARKSKARVWRAA